MPCSLEIKWRPLAAAMGTKWDLRLQKVFWKILSVEAQGGAGYIEPFPNNEIAALSLLPGIACLADLAQN